MRGWILYRYTLDDLPPTNYEIPRFVEMANQQGIDLRVVTPQQFELIVTRDDRKSVLLDGQVTPLPDFLLPRMGAATTYFALSIIRHLERLGVQIINASQAIEQVRDKLYTQQILAASNLPTPKTMFAKFPVDIDLVERQLGFPIVVKTVSGSQGSGVYLSETRKNFEDLMTLIDSTKPNSNIILQEFIANSRGRDLRVIVVGGRVIGCMQRSAMDGGFKANVSRGGSTQAYMLTPEIELLALEATRILGLDIAGVDLLFAEDHFKICEVNSSPGFKGMENSLPDLNVADEIYRYIRIRLGQFEAMPLNGKAVSTDPTPPDPKAT